MKTFTFPFIITLLCLGSILQVHAQSEKSVRLGKADEVRSKFEKKTDLMRNKGIAVQIVQDRPGKSPLVLELKSTKKEEAAEFFYGEVADVKNSNFYLKIKGNEASGFIMMKDQKKYYEYSTLSSGQVHLVEKPIDEVICINYTHTRQNTDISAEQLHSVTSAVPLLESLPGASAVVLLDFDGHTVTGTLWNHGFNNGEPIVAEPAYLSMEEMMGVWKMMSEDFRPFAINVTTSEAVYQSAPANRRTRVIFTPTNYFYPGHGGAAYVGSYSWGDQGDGGTPSFVWNQGIKGAGEAGSHEVGHTFNLVHDGRGAPYDEEYFSGQQDWAPIMGTGYSVSSVQWSKGEYPFANNTEDDLEMIAYYSGVGYRADDHGNTNHTATPLIITGPASISPDDNIGVIETRNDTDVFSFTTAAGYLNLFVSPEPSFHNLSVSLKLTNSSGDVIPIQKSDNFVGSITMDLPAGTYFLEVDGIKGISGADSDYGSIGKYTLSGLLALNSNPVIAITSPTDRQTFTIPQNPIPITVSVTDEGGAVTKVEFFSGTTKIGEDYEAPYMFEWRQPHVGTYPLTAIATDDKGVKMTSQVIHVIVAKPGKGNLASGEQSSKNALLKPDMEELEVYPNPISVNNALKVDLPAHYQDVQVIFHDLSTGRKVLQQTYNDTRALEVDVKTLARGLYGITVIAGEKAWTKKIVIKP